MTEYTIDMIKGTTVMEQMRSLIKVVIEFINGEGGDIEELRQMIQTEIADRTAQDGQLQLQIQAEATARISQDNSLSSQIQAETVQRIDADDTLQADLEQEQQIREQSDGNIETSLQTEIDQRQSQDTALDTAIQNEVTARQNQDSQLNTAIQDEASQRASADSGLSHNITDLTTRVGTVETSVSDIIQGTQPVGAAQNQGHADTQSEAQVGDHIVSTTAVIGDDTHPVKIVNGVPVQVSGELQGKLIQGTGITIDANNQISQSSSGGTEKHTFTAVSTANQFIRSNTDKVMFIRILSAKDIGGNTVNEIDCIGIITITQQNEHIMRFVRWTKSERPNHIVFNDTSISMWYQSSANISSNVVVTQAQQNVLFKSATSIEVWTW